MKTQITNQDRDDLDDKRIIDLLNDVEITIPPEFESRIKAMAWKKAQELKRSHAKLARPAMEEIFLARAAKSGTDVRKELTSQSGDTILRVFESRKDRALCLVMIEVTPNRQSEYEGRCATLLIGEKQVLEMTIQGGEAECEIVRTQLESEGEWRVRILDSE